MSIGCGSHVVRDPQQNVGVVPRVILTSPNYIFFKSLDIFLSEDLETFLEKPFHNKIA